MNKRKIQKSEFDALGIKLLRSARLTSEEIDSIASAPGLFDAVCARVADVEAVSGSRAKRFGWMPAAASAALSVVLVSWVYFGFLNSQEVPQISRTRDIPPVLTVVHDTSKQDFTSIVKQRSIEPEIAAPRPPAAKIAYREDAKEDVRPVHAKRLPVPARPESEFFALEFAGNLEDAVRGGHVVRVDMTRSSLFALGVDLPLENDAKFIKTDVLVSRDGVPRAIRFVD